MTFSSLKFIEKFLSSNDDLSDANMALSDADVRLDQNATLLNVGRLWVYAKIPYNYYLVIQVMIHWDLNDLLWCTIVS